MAFDGIVVNSIVDELSNNLTDGRIDKVYQPEKDEIYIQIRNKGENHIVLISSNSSNPRIYLTNRTKKNPPEPPMFCMILRKHLVGSKILGVEQFLNDRIVFIDIASRDELGFDSEKRLIIEIMGRHSNIILVDKQNSRVIDSITRVSEDMSSIRQVYPGSIYELPPEQDRLNPLDLSWETFIKRIQSDSEDKKLFKFFYSNYLGLSPLISREISYRSGLDKNIGLGELSSHDLDCIYKNFESMVNLINKKDFKPCIIFDSKEEQILAFHAMDIKQFKDSISKSYLSISQLLDDYYYQKDMLERIGQKSQSLKKLVTNNLDRALNKLKKQRDELKEAKDREKYKVYADLISANIYQIDKGAKEVTLDNFYDENLGKIIIPLDEKQSAASNAQRYYKKYSRLKNAAKLLELEIPSTKNEILYLQSVLSNIENSTHVEDLEDIKEELIKESYIKGASKKRKNNHESQAHHYVSSSGLDIFVGKNNRQNDELTFKKSSRDDIWLHIQKMPGSHVIIRSASKELDATSLEEAALLAAYYSSARSSKNIPIDYTERKNVKKPKGAKAGLVIYEDFDTIFVSPEKKLIDKIKKM